MPTITGRFKLPSGTKPLRGTWYVRLRTLSHTMLDPDNSIRGGIETAKDSGNGATMTLPAGTYEAFFESSDLNPITSEKDVWGWYPFVVAGVNLTWAAIMETPVDVPVTPSDAARAEAARDAAEAAAASVYAIGTDNGTAVADALGPSPLGTTTNAMPSLLARINATPVGGTVQLRDGDYTWLTRGSFTKPIHIKGDKGRTRIRIKTQGPITAATNNVTFEDIEFIGDQAAVGNVPFLFDSTLTASLYGGWHFENCVFDTVGVAFAKHDALQPDGTPNTTGTGFKGAVSLRRCEHKNHKGQYGLEFRGVDVFNVEDPWVHHIGTPDNANGEGIKVTYGTTNGRVRGGVLELNYRDGIDTYAGGSVTVEGVTIRNNAQNGIENKWATTDAAVHSNIKVKVLGCTVYGNGSYGVLAAAHNTKVHGCTLYDNVAGNIRVSGALDASTTAYTTGVSIKDNTCIGGQYGIVLAGAVERFTIAGNHASGASVDGIALSPQSRDGIVSGNQSFGNANRGVRLDGVGHRIGPNRSQDGDLGYYLQPGCDVFVASRGSRTAYKTAASSRTSTTSPTTDVHLQFLNLPANSLWRLSGDLYLQSVSETPDFKGGWSVPAGATGRWRLGGASSSATTWANAQVQTAGDLATNLGTGIDDTSYGHVTVHGTIKIGSTAGDVLFQWSQLTSDATQTLLLDLSAMTLERLA